MTISITLTEKSKETIINHSELFGKTTLEMVHTFVGPWCRTCKFCTISYDDSQSTLTAEINDEFFDDLVGIIHATFSGVKGLGMMLEAMLKPFLEKYREEKKPLENIEG